jgi:integrase
MPGCASTVAGTYPNGQPKRIKETTGTIAGHQDIWIACRSDGFSRKRWCLSAISPTAGHSPAPTALQVQKVCALSGAVFVTANGKRLKKSTLDSRWSTVREAAGFFDYRCHGSRHSGANLLPQNNATLVQIAELLGHKGLPLVAKNHDVALDDELRESR